MTNIQIPALSGWLPFPVRVTDITNPMLFPLTVQIITGCIWVTNMTRRGLVVLRKRFIDKKIGSYRANAKNSILVTWNMSLFQRVISASRFRIGILDIVHASD